MNTIDKLTLELLMNRSLWSKNMENTDPYKIEEQNIFKQKLKIYKIRILKMLSKYLENPELNVNPEMDEIFEVYAKENIKYFEMNDLAIERFYEESEPEIEPDPDNILCGESEEHPFSYEQDMEFEETHENPNSSCWSNDKVSKLPSKYTMDMYVKRK